MSVYKTSTQCSQTATSTTRSAIGCLISSYLRLLWSAGGDKSRCYPSVKDLMPSTWFCVFSLGMISSSWQRPWRSTFSRRSQRCPRRKLKFLWSPRDVEGAGRSQVLSARSCNIVLKIYIYEFRFTAKPSIILLLATVLGLCLCFLDILFNTIMRMYHESNVMTDTNATSQTCVSSFYCVLSALVFPLY